jgi:hypothetical protein
MRGGHVAIGLALITLATSLSALGHHDGLLGATPARELPAPGQEPRPVLVRLIILGSAEEAQPLVAELARRAGEAPTSDPQHVFVPARLEHDVDTPVLLRINAPAPDPGRLVVVEGRAQSYIPAQGGAPAILYVDATELRVPLLFKSV